MANLWQDPQWAAAINERSASAGGARSRRPGRFVPRSALARARLRSAAAASQPPLGWLAAKALENFAEMRGQSSIWFMLQDFRLSSLNVTVTLTLSSSLDLQRGAGG
eukprot:69376-Chlamydomonas_euryale.AAC.1